MKKKHVWILLFSLFVVALFGTSGIKADAASKAATKKKVYKAITSVKNGKYTYYYDGKAIYRENSKGKKTKLSKYATNGEFIINGDDIYYFDKTGVKLYRMKKNGKSQKRYSGTIWNVDMIKGGYLYFNNTIGVHRMKTSGKGRTKILGYSNSYDRVYIGNRIFYTSGKNVKRADGTGYDYLYSIYSVNLKGKDKKNHAKGIKAQLNGFDLSIMANGQYLFSFAAGGEIGVIDTKAKKPTYQALMTDDKKTYVPVGLIGDKIIMAGYEYEEEDVDLFNPIRGTLYSLSVSGEVKSLAEVPDMKGHVGVTKVEKQGNYYWVSCAGDDDFNYNYIYNKKWELVKKVTRKYGDVERLKIKGKKLYIVFNKSEDQSFEEHFYTYKIYNLK